MTNPIFAKVTIIHKNGLRTDYKCVTGFEVWNPMPRMHPEYEPSLLIKGESVDTFGMPRINIDKLPIKDLEITIIDWYIPKI